MDSSAQALKNNTLFSPEAKHRRWLSGRQRKRDAFKNMNPITVFNFTGKQFTISLELNHVTLRCNGVGWHESHGLFTIQGEEASGGIYKQRCLRLEFHWPSFERPLAVELKTSDKFATLVGESKPQFRRSTPISLTLIKPGETMSKETSENIERLNRFRAHQQREVNEGQMKLKDSGEEGTEEHK